MYAVAYGRGAKGATAPGGTGAAFWAPQVSKTKFSSAKDARMLGYN